MFNHFNAKWKISGAFLWGRLRGILSLLFAGTRYNYASLYIAYRHRQTWTQVEAAIFNLNVATEYKKKEKRNAAFSSWIGYFYSMRKNATWLNFLIDTVFLFNAIQVYQIHILTLQQISITSS